MHVLMLPYDGHPYQKQLIDSLESDMTHVTTTGESVVTILGNMVEYGFFDVIHIHWIYSFIDSNHYYFMLLKSIVIFLALYLVKTGGANVVWTAHNLTDHSSKYEKFEKEYYKKITEHVVKNIIVHSPEAKTILVSEYDIEDHSDKVVSIPHGNFISYYENTYSQRESRDILNIDNDEFVYLFLGNILEYKNVPDLVSSFKNLKINNGRLLIAGRPSSEELKAKIGEKCHNNSNIDIYLYFVPDDKIQLYMNAADVVVLPYEKILTSGSAILAMSFGKPVIAPNKGCLKDILPESSNFKYYNHYELEEKMLEAYESRDVLEEYGEENLSHISSFDWDMIAKKTKSVYKNA